MATNLVVLNECKDSKELILLEDDKSIFNISKSPFATDEAQALILLVQQEPEKDILVNTITSTKYNKTINVDGQQTCYEINVMKPQNLQEINKYKKQQYYFFRETSELFIKYTIPYIQSIPFETQQWIDDYANDIKKPLFRGDGFFLVPDIKWNMKDMSYFYGICFSQDASILSIRSLRQIHIPLLRKIRSEVLNYIYTNTGLKEEEVVIYCHYHPSFWHFHIHFTSIHFPSLARNNSIGKAILLDTVIQNISIDDLYYSKATLTISLGTSHSLYEKFNNQIDLKQ